MSLVSKRDFIGGDGRAYLYTAAEGLVPRMALDATRRYYENKVLGREGWVHHSAVERSCREGLAALMGTDAGDIALLGSASEGINAIFALIDWKPGDNVVVPSSDLEFPSVVLPAMKLRAQGVELRVVDPDGWVIEPEHIGGAVDERTRLVLLSHVSYRTGFRFDLEAIAEIVTRAGAIFAVDATQSMGVIPVPAHACDFLVATSCKWLLAPHGVGAFYWNRQRHPDIEPASIGWYSVVDDLQLPYDLKPDAGRFEPGGPNLPALYGLEEGLKVLLDVGVERIERHVLDLGAYLMERLAGFDLDVMTPLDPACRAGIVSWVDPDCAETAARLAEMGVIVTGSAGRVRVAMHLYNDEGDVDRLIGMMQQRQPGTDTIRVASQTA